MSEFMRDAFDSQNSISTLAKSDKCVASHPHISVVGHITPNELKEKMRNVDFSNGFANRFVWIESYSANRFPFGSIPVWHKETELLDNIQNVIAWARKNLSIEMTWTEEGRTA